MLTKYFFLVLYTLFAKWLPPSSYPIIGGLSSRIRYQCCKRIFFFCGKRVNVERGASFGNGFKLSIGDDSGLGRYCKVPSSITIGKDVMIAPNLYIVDVNHSFDDPTLPMRLQGIKKSKAVVIEDDVWIGRNVIIGAGRTIRKGSIIAAGTVLIKDFPEYSIIGGNPSILIKMRR